MAVRIAREVAKTKIPVNLRYMNAYERKVIHTKLSTWKDVSYSICKSSLLFVKKLWALFANGARETIKLFRESEIFAREEFEKICDKVIITTVDGSCGVKGFVTDALGFDYTYTYCCGPEAMLKAVYNKTVTSGQYSFEERMGCGFGACMGCSCKTKYGNKRICKDGPVLVKEEIIW